MDAHSIIALLGLLLISVAVIWGVVWWPRLRLRRIHARAFPDAWRVILCRRLAFYEQLPVVLQARFQDCIKVFMHDTRFIGCGGQAINDEICVTVAAWACLLIVNRDDGCYPGPLSVLVYPSTFITDREVEDEHGLVCTDRVALLGESWSEGKVVLAWDNVDNGVMNVRDGYNVVLHEFAHQLDHESGATNGAPVMPAADRASWNQVLAQEFEQLQRQADAQRYSLMDHYGATDPAEFFAVATETFFERPELMARLHPALYAELAGFYRLDPATWQRSA